MSTHNICYLGEIRKILSGYSLLSGALHGRFSKNRILGYGFKFYFCIISFKEDLACVFMN